MRFARYTIPIATIVFGSYLLPIHAQTVVYGTVSCNGQPVGFAHIQINTSNRGTSTNAAGDFQLTVEKEDTLHVSSVGYEPATLIVTPAHGQTLAIELARNATALPEFEVRGKQITATEVLKNARKAIKRNYQTAAFTTSSICTELYRENGRYVKAASANATIAGTLNWTSTKKLEPIRLDSLWKTEARITDTRFTTDAGGFVWVYPMMQIQAAFRSERLKNCVLAGITVEDSVPIYQIACSKETEHTTWTGTFFIRGDDFAVVKISTHWSSDTSQGKQRDFASPPRYYRWRSRSEDITYRKFGEYYYPQSIQHRLTTEHFLHPDGTVELTDEQIVSIAVIDVSPGKTTIPEANRVKWMQSLMESTSPAPRDWVAKYKHNPSEQIQTVISDLQQ